MPPTPQPAATARPRRRVVPAALGVLALIGSVVGLAPAARAANSSVCDIYCDARDPSHATSDRSAVTATSNGRTITLHLSDNDVMGWASIDSSSTGDELWLDRSYDGGRSWDDGSKLGDTWTPTGSAGWRSQMYNVDDWNNAGVGALRACARTNGASITVCTGWARVNRNAWSDSTAAATALMMDYDKGTGEFNGWWTSATALTSIIDNVRTSGMTSYKYAISTTYDKLKSAQGGDFRNEYADDTGWWGLAWVDAYDVTGDTRYLDTAKADADHIATMWDSSTCGGGVVWSTNSDYKNAISNELYLQLTAALHNRISGDTTYLQRAEDEWSWFKDSGMINSGNTINDGLASGCVNNNQVTWTYNQGVILGGLAELHRATGDDSLLTAARTLADASTSSSYLNPGGTLHEPYEPDGTGCVSNGDSFKGEYIRGLGILNKELSDHPYSDYLDGQAATLKAKDRNTLAQYGPHWAGDYTGTGNGCQHSAVDLLNAAES
ncbi:Glycosyl hydrolase family 76 [Actinacidiphila alni]|uniref:Glycosyl hydrolase family 76 n=1 Tax=Actinacidiphila alni TaxID=380248 RepID=A0A1I1XG63_9ACTN|nr:glycoside hydrolase family 76 protein [Actinacidiphila alni]SFE06151.1 Glycosyl hydrolase family 76 [Actinacidiphila alni]